MGHRRSISFPVYGIIAISAIVAPLLLLSISATAASVVGLVIAGLWLLVMPRGCINGAFICFPITMAQIGLGVMWATRLCTM